MSRGEYGLDAPLRDRFCSTAHRRYPTARRKSGHIRLIARRKPLNVTQIAIASLRSPTHLARRQRDHT